MVIATPSQRDTEGLSLQRDITLVKAALFCADQVELVSPGAAMLGSVAFMADRGEPALLELLRRLDPDTLRALSGPTLPDGLQTALPLLGLVRNLDPALLQAIPGAEGLAQQLSAFNEGMARSAEQFTVKAEELLVNAGAEDLIRH